MHFIGRLDQANAHPIALVHPLCDLDRVPVELHLPGGNDPLQFPRRVIAEVPGQKRIDPHAAQVAFDDELGSEGERGHGLIVARTNFRRNCEFHLSLGAPVSDRVQHHPMNSGRSTASGSSNHPRMTCRTRIARAGSSSLATSLCTQFMRKRSTTMFFVFSRNNRDRRFTAVRDAFSVVMLQLKEPLICHAPRAGLSADSSRS